MELWHAFPVLTITGPRQSGKTTLVKSLDLSIPYVSLEDLDVRELASSDPRGFLDNYPDGAILDEVQRVPDLFSYIQGIVDSTDRKFVLSGSQNFQLIESISQSLAGRTAILKLMPLALSELGHDRFGSYHEYVFQGSFPRLYDQPIDAYDYYSAYLSTYVERDVRLIKNIEKLSLFTKFLQLCAGRIGQPLNLSNLANDTGISPNTAQDWISVLEASYVVHLLQPYHKNYNKRITKSPKLYFWDTGLACNLLGLESSDQLQSFYLVGNLFENMVVNELFKSRFNEGKRSNLYYWQNRNRQEIDIVVSLPDRELVIEVKSGKTISSSYWRNIDYWQSLQQKPSEAYVVYGGDKEWQLDRGKILSWKSISQIQT